MIRSGERIKLAITAALFTPFRYFHLIGFGYQGGICNNFENRPTFFISGDVCHIFRLEMDSLETARRDERSLANGSIDVF